MSATATIQSSDFDAMQVVTPIPQSAGRGLGRSYTYLGGRGGRNGGRNGRTNGRRHSGAIRASGDVNCHLPAKLTHYLAALQLAMQTGVQ